MNKRNDMRLVPIFLITVLLLIGTAQILAETKTTFDQKVTKIEFQIDALEGKGIENLSDDEFERLDELQDLLLKTYKEEKQATARTNEKIDSILGSLSSKKTDKK